jgi:hypothetical protein
MERNRYRMSAPASTPYDALVEMIERELELAGQGRFDDLAELAASREAFRASLPATPPASARAALERANLMQQRLEIELLRGREAVLLELAEIERGRRMARGYGPRPQAPRVSASA